MIDRLRRVSREERWRYALPDYHWLVLYSCLQLYGDLHNDGATGDQIGPYEIEHIDVDSLVDRFFFDTDFLRGATLLSAEEAAPGHLGVTQQASKIAAGLRPETKDLRMRKGASSGRARAAVRRRAGPRRAAMSALPPSGMRGGRGGRVGAATPRSRSFFQPGDAGHLGQREECVVLHVIAVWGPWVRPRRRGLARDGPAAEDGLQVQGSLDGGDNAEAPSTAGTGKDVNGRSNLKCPDGT